MPRIFFLTLKGTPIADVDGPTVSSVLEPGSKFRGNFPTKFGGIELIAIGPLRVRRPSLFHLAYKNTNINEDMLALELLVYFCT
jgi:hypothetical protein